MIADSGILTNLEQTILTVFQGGFNNIQPDAQHLLGILGVLDIALVSAFLVVEQKDYLPTLLSKIMILGLFTFFIQKWQSLVDVTVQGFIYAGVKAGGGVGVPALTNPSSIINYAWQVTEPINTEITNLSKASWVGFNATILDLLIAKYLILFPLFVIALQAFVCYLEFYIIAVLAMILLPFGVFKHTKFLAEKAFGAVIAFGIKLMVLAFILSVSMSVIQAYTVSPIPTFQQSVCLGVAVFAIAFLSVSAPKIASGLMSGSPSISAGDAASIAAAGASAAYTGARMGTQVASKAVNTGLDSIKAATAYLNRKS